MLWVWILYRPRPIFLLHLVNRRASLYGSTKIVVKETPGRGSRLILLILNISKKKKHKKLLPFKNYFCQSYFLYSYKADNNKGKNKAKSAAIFTAEDTIIGTAKD